MRRDYRYLNVRGWRLPRRTAADKTTLVWVTIELVKSAYLCAEPERLPRLLKALVATQRSALRSLLSSVRMRRNVDAYRYDANNLGAEGRQRGEMLAERRF